MGLIDPPQEPPATNVIDIFVQAEGRRDIRIVRISPDSSLADFVVEANRLGTMPASAPGDLLVSLEDQDEPIAAGTLMAAGVRHRSRVHVHRCRRVEVVVHFNGKTIDRQFPPSATIAQVTRWAVGKKGFALDPADAIEHVLQLSGTTDRPDEDAHVGTLVAAPCCGVSFDLVPKQRIEG